MHCLTDTLCNRFTQEELFSLYAELADVPQSTSVNDLIASILWIRAAEKFQHPTTLAAYRTYLRLLVQYTATLPSLPQNFDVLKNFTSMPSVTEVMIQVVMNTSTAIVELADTN